MMKEKILQRIDELLKYANVDLLLDDIICHVGIKQSVKCYIEIIDTVIKQEIENLKSMFNNEKYYNKINNIVNSNNIIYQMDIDYNSSYDEIQKLGKIKINKYKKILQQIKLLIL